PVDLVVAADRAGRDAGQRVDLATLILRESQDIGDRLHALDLSDFHGPLAVGALGAEKDLAVHLGERLRPVAEDVFALPGLMCAAVDVAAGDRDTEASLRLRGAVLVDHDRLREPGLVASR